jgi:hypothetical protein
MIAKVNVKGAAAAMAALTLLAGCGSNPPSTASSKPQAVAPATGADVPPVLGHDGPCAGERMQLPASRAELKVAAPLLVPRSKLASFSNIKELWACASGGYVAVFDTGVVVNALPGYDNVDNASKWSDYVGSNGHGRVQTVHGNPGMIEDPDADHSGLAQTIVGGWLIQVVGDSKIPASDLVTVADSM